MRSFPFPFLVSNEGCVQLILKMKLNIYLAGFASHDLLGLSLFLTFDFSLTNRLLEQNGTTKEHIRVCKLNVKERTDN